MGVLRVPQTSPAHTAVNPYISELIHREQTLPCKSSLRNSAPNCGSGSANSAEEKCTTDLGPHLGCVGSIISIPYR